MSNDGHSRNLERAFAWAEGIMGGKVVAKEDQKRWRPQWFLDIEKPDGSIHRVVLRGWRAATTGTEEENRRFLEREAAVTRALQGTGVKVAAFHGYDPEGGWMLIDRFEGSPHIGDVEDLQLQKKIFHSYMENLALMHSLDCAKLGLEGVVDPPASYEDAIGGEAGGLAWYRKEYDKVVEKDPEPLVELGLWFASTHKPRPTKHYSLSTGDPGINNFMFQGDRFVGLYDLELAYIGDPLREICQMRLKTMCHGSGERYLHDLPDGIRHWADALGVELDRESIGYWTVVAMLQGPMLTVRIMNKPDPEYIAEFEHMNTHQPHYRRGLAEALAEYYGLELTVPEKPEPHSDRMSRYYELVTRQLLETHVRLSTSDEHKFLLERTADFTKTLELDKAYGEHTRAANMADLSAVLGQPVKSEREGLAMLQARIKKSPEQDIPGVVQALFNIEVRNAWVFEPMQRWAKYRTAAPLDRMW